MPCSAVSTCLSLFSDYKLLEGRTQIYSGGTSAALCRFSLKRTSLTFFFRSPIFKAEHPPKRGPSLGVNPMKIRIWGLIHRSPQQLEEPLLQSGFTATRCFTSNASRLDFPRIIHYPQLLLYQCLSSRISAAPLTRMRFLIRRLFSLTRIASPFLSVLRLLYLELEVTLFA